MSSQNDLASLASTPPSSDEPMDTSGFNEDSQELALYLNDQRTDANDCCHPNQLLPQEAANKFNEQDAFVRSGTLEAPVSFPSSQPSAEPNPTQITTHSLFRYIFCCCWHHPSHTYAYKQVSHSQPHESNSKSRKFTIDGDDYPSMQLDDDEHCAFEAHLLKQLSSKSREEESKKAKDALLLVERLCAALENEDFTSSFNGVLLPTSIKLLFEPIRLEGFAQLCQQLLDDKNIKSFEVGVNSISTKSQPLTELTGLLTMNCTLTRFSIWGNGLEDNGALVIAQALKHNAHLRELHLNNNEIGNKGLIALCDALSCACCALESLDVSGNIGISDEGAIALATALRTNKSLQYCNLSANSISSAGAINLGFLISSGKNTVLTKLDLSSNLISDKGIIALALAVAKNTHFSSLRLQGNIINANSREAVRHSLKEAHHVTVTLDGTDCSGWSV